MDKFSVFLFWISWAFQFERRIILYFFGGDYFYPFYSVECCPVSDEGFIVCFELVGRERDADIFVGG